MVARVVDLPEPVGPVMRTRPRGRLQPGECSSISFGKTQLLEADHVFRDGAHDAPDGTPLLKDIDPEATVAG